MPTTFPGSIDDFLNPNPADKLNNPSHSTQHGNANDAIEAIETYLGVASSTDPATITGRIVALEEGGGSGSGTVTSVGATAPVTSTGGNAPVIGMPKATTTINGYLSSVDFNTFNGKQALLVSGNNIKTINGVSILGSGDLVITSGVSSVIGTAPVVSSGGATPAISMPKATASVDGYLDNADWTLFNGKQNPATTLAGYGITDAVSLGGTQTITGLKTFNSQVTFIDTTTGEFGLVDIVPDPYSSTGLTMQMKCDSGMTLTAPYLVLDTSNLQLVYPGAVAGNLLVITAIDSFGVASVGLQAGLPAAYAVQDTHDADVVIKAAGVAPPTNWVALGLEVTLEADAPSGTATLSFEIVLENPTSRSGVVEYGMTVNGSAPLARNIVTQISPNFLQSVALSIPLQNPYSTGDVIALVARVISNDNNAFSLTMKASPTEVAVMRFSVVGATGTLPAPSNMVTTDTAQTITGQKTFTSEILGTASIAKAVDDLNSTELVKQWIGTQAEYDALGAWDSYTFYTITDAPDSGGGTPVNMVTTDTAQEITGYKTFFSGSFDVEDATGTKVLQVLQQDGNYGSTAVVIDGGNRTNQPALALNNLGAGVAGLGMSWASGGTFNMALGGDDFSLGLSNRSMLFSHVGAFGTAYNAAFIFRTDQAGVPSLLPANVKSIVKVQHVLDGQMDMLQFSDSTGTPMSWVDKDGKFNGTATAVEDTGAGSSMKLWYGTEAEFIAIVTKDPTTLYFRSA